MKKMKRRERRKEIAEKERLEEEALHNDPEEQRKMLMLEQEEAERIERDRIAFQEREKAWIIKQQQQRDEDLDNKEEEEEEEYLEEEEEEEEVEDGPPEIIWQGNEIIIKKKKVNPPNILLLHHQVCYVQVILSLSRFLISIHYYSIHSFIHSQEHDVNNNRPTSNPFPPESPSQARSNSTLLENNNNVAQQLPNFGTELVRPNFVYY
jgi:cyclin-dependent kinase 12/13